MYYNPRKKVLISKSFKTASSSLYTFCVSNLMEDGCQQMNMHRTIEQLIDRWQIPTDDLVKIVGIRNPWDYVASAYHWAQMNRECPLSYSFNDFVFKESDFNWKKQLKFWDVENMDDVLVFEDFSNELQRISKLYDLQGGIGKPVSWEKKTLNQSMGYRTLYHNQEEIDEVGSVFENHIAFFERKFGIKYTF